MTPADAAELLTIAAAFDRRTISTADAIAWADALQGLDVADCAHAIRAHFRESGEYLMPIHVRRGVRRIRSERLERAFVDVPAADADPDDIGLWLASVRAVNARIAGGGVEVTLTVEPERDVGVLLGTTLAAMPVVPGPSGRFPLPPPNPRLASTVDDLRPAAVPTEETE